MFAAVKEARGCIAGKLPLIEAWAVFAERVAIGGPEENMERGGGSKMVEDAAGSTDMLP